MKTIEKNGKTVDEAVSKALDELGVKKDDVEIEVLDEGSKGFLGIIGGRNAVVRVTYKTDYVKIAHSFVSGILNKMNLDFVIQIEKKASTLNINISGPKLGLIIGNRGETLDSLQYLTSLAVNKHAEADNEHVKIFIDAENYRQKRQETLVNLARKLSHTVRKTGKRIELEPMNAYERRVIHCALEADRFVETYSLGDEPNRKVVITLKEKKKID